jgi:putative secretion ATPase (PEP-CTERM system associated)
MYDQFYGLTGRPFQLTPDPQYYFESLTHRKALSYLGYGLAQGEGFIVITGDVGAGKSTLVSHLMQTIDRSRLTATNIVTSQLDGNDMVQMAAESFGIHTAGQDKAATLKAIENYLHAEARAGRRCLLIVDEAQNLSISAIEELRMLSNFQLGSQALLQIFLLGQPEFRDLVQSSQELEQLRQRIIATHHLQPMDADEVEPYVVHRLSCAGWTGHPQFTPEAFATLYAHTDGIPRKLNTLMSRVLLMGAVEQLSVIDGDLVDAVVADMAGLPFEYEAPMSARGEVSLSLPEDAPVSVQDFTASTENADKIEPTEHATAQSNGHAVDVEVKDFGTVTDFAQRMAQTDAPPPIVNDAAEAISPPVMEFVPSLAPEQTMAQPAMRVTDDIGADRIDALEARVAEQDQALRRVLSMMIDWMDKEASLTAPENANRRSVWN